MFGFWRLGEVDMDDYRPFHVALDEGEGPLCAVENCLNRTGSDDVYFCSHVHHDQWWASQGRTA